MPTELFDPRLIDVPQRLRGLHPQHPDPLMVQHLQWLEDSVKRYGFLQPLLLDQNNQLQDGWCRLQVALRMDLPTVPVFRRSRLNDSEYFEVELEANLRRLDFTWQQNVHAVAKIHKQHQREAVLKGTEWTQQMTGDLLGGYSMAYISNCLSLDPVIDNAEYLDCDGITNALRLQLRQREDSAVAEQAKRMNLQRSVVPAMTASGTAVSNPVDPASDVADLFAATDDVEHVVNLSETLFLGDMLNLLPRWPEACVDHIITDPPYGIEMTNLEQTGTGMDVSRVELTHVEDDNKALLVCMFPHLFRVLKDGGFLVLWCNIMNWQLLYNAACGAGFGVQRWPIVWHKTSSCLNQMAHVNLTKNVELAMVCRKGNARLPTPVGTCVVNAATAEHLSNPFAKPLDVWRFLYNAFTTPGQLILDPFAGEGSAVVAAMKCQRRSLAIECDPTHYPYLVTNVKDYWTRVFQKVRFV